MAGKVAFRLLMTVKAVLSPTAFGVTGVVEDAQGRVLLVRHSYKTGWALPGGGVDRGEPPAQAVMRELAEEVGLSGGTAQFLGLYTRRAGWATNVIALYRVTGATVAFKPNFEIREICFADPAALPFGVTSATARRLAELAGTMPVSPYW
ncbi:MAG TPA: NUDIX domain-containing protein [Rhizomicrobium sp.]|nr:NUDIX domain-containing protein [Rhizomicrobium sp.]